MEFELHFVFSSDKAVLLPNCLENDFRASFDLVNSKSNTSFTKKKDEEFISNK